MNNEVKKEKIETDPRKATTQDAALTAAAIQENPKTAPSIDFEDDYQLAQEMSKGSDCQDESSPLSAT
ncbi:hypothetical protein PN498_26910 [Oscillatoria sp. CS-180]|uniref:hypothetical protein n=1 Tax=Oscillatoria sp. CS-180 TaxID=3021720 RepID=UPI00232BF10A|nr:hypothetical protein [Oscillatoria sp. CS-180]MDB9529648.1 hypothetical protein [Oscillatoria sp. CS-180]